MKRFVIIALILSILFIPAWRTGCPSGDIRWCCHNIDVTVPRPPGANPPATGTEDEFPTLDFDKGTDESIFATHLIFPTYRSGDSIKVCLLIFVDVAPTADTSVVFGVEYKMVSNDSVFNFSVGTKTVLDTVNLTSTNKQVHYSILHFDPTGFVRDAQCLMRIYRDANNAADNYDDDARLHGIDFGFKCNI